MLPAHEPDKNAGPKPPRPQETGGAAPEEGRLRPLFERAARELGRSRPDEGAVPAVSPIHAFPTWPARRARDLLHSDRCRRDLPSWIAPPPLAGSTSLVGFSCQPLASLASRPGSSRKQPASPAPRPGSSRKPLASPAPRLGSFRKPLASVAACPGSPAQALASRASRLGERDRPLAQAALLAFRFGNARFSATTARSASFTDVESGKSAASSGSSILTRRPTAAALSACWPRTARLKS